MKNITHRDYLDILKYYKIDAAHLKKNDVRKKAEHLLATKLCKCIKKVDPDEKKSIAICTKSIFNRKYLL